MDQYHFLLLPECSFIGLAALLEPLRVANRFMPGMVRWQILSLDGQPVTASNGMAIQVDSAIEDVEQCQCLFVLSSYNPLKHYSVELGHWLRQIARGGAVLGGIETGCFALAEAGLLRAGDSVTLHWEAIPAFQERYAHIAVSQALFLIGEQRISSAGALASVDMALALLARRYGDALALNVSELLVQGPRRQHSDPQRLQVLSRYKTHHPALVRAIGLMEQHLENLLSIEALAQRLSVSRRQLERLFQQHLETSPACFYLNLRLERSRHLLRQTDLTIVEISIACGFESPSYFSRAYRQHFACSPRQDRRQVY